MTGPRTEPQARTAADRTVARLRALHSSRYTYVWNGWADGRNEIPLEMSAGQAIRRILRETGHTARADFETFRAREEFYDTVRDPGCLRNLVADRSLSAELSAFRRELLELLERTKDHEAPNFRAHLETLEQGGAQPPSEAGLASPQHME